MDDTRASSDRRAYAFQTPEEAQSGVRLEKPVLSLIRFCCAGSSLLATHAGAKIVGIRKAPTYRKEKAWPQETNGFLCFGS